MVNSSFGFELSDWLEVILIKISVAKVRSLSEVIDYSQWPATPQNENEYREICEYLPHGFVSSFVSQRVSVASELKVCIEQTVKCANSFQLNSADFHSVLGRKTISQPGISRNIQWFIRQQCTAVDCLQSQNGFYFADLSSDSEWGRENARMQQSKVNDFKLSV